MTPRSAIDRSARAARPGLGLVAALVAAVWLGLAPVASAQQDSSAWLQQPLSSWNQPGMALPTAQPPTNASGNPNCDASARWPETPQDQSLVNAGWELSTAYQAGWGIIVVLGSSSEDGMCRPLGYNYFVFVDGAFAGTLSPVLMDSRTSGSGFFSGLSAGHVSARFVRYAPTDASCCPSLPASDVDYSVQRATGGPVVIPTDSFVEGSTAGP